MNNSNQPQKKKCLVNLKSNLSEREVSMQEGSHESGTAKFQNKCFTLILECSSLLIQESLITQIQSQTSISTLKTTSNLLEE